ncbi:unnamed protein product, partial [Prorocentrum cordatum]
MKYLMLSSLMPEVVGRQQKHSEICSDFNNAYPKLHGADVDVYPWLMQLSSNQWLSAPGALMGYAATGDSDPSVHRAVRKYFRRYRPVAPMIAAEELHRVFGYEEPWLHALLHAVAKWIGLAALINTSFNSKGKPITNSVTESLQMLSELPELDYVLIEDWLFR